MFDLMDEEVEVKIQQSLSKFLKGKIYISKVCLTKLVKYMFYSIYNF